MEEIQVKRRLSINEWREDSRPRERLLSVGAASLSNAELLAILIHTGTASKNAVEMMQEVLNACEGSLDKLGTMTYDELISFDGIGPAKAVTIMAACEFGRRRMTKDTVKKIRMDSSETVFQELLRARFWDHTEEECCVVLLNQGLYLISVELVGKGGLTSVSADIRKIMKMAILKNATALILAHNHPSGSLKPGRDDDQTTSRLKEACKMMDIRLLDHLIVNGNSYYSYMDEGKL